VLIPSFATERTQDLLYHLHNLMKAGKVPHCPVYLDSPMAIRVTEVFRRHPELFDPEARALLDRGEHPCDLPTLVVCNTAEQSKAINTSPTPSIIIAGAGMCTGGRIKHHLRNHLGKPETTVLFIGYQAAGTLGRILLDGVKQVRLFGEMHRVRATIERISGFSAHADEEELWQWLRGSGTKPSRVFVTHGEPEAALHFANRLKEAGYPATAPDYADAVVLTA